RGFDAFEVSRDKLEQWRRLGEI
ncbi:hypothetical protein R2601_15995, partial [Salipiger bermudensis HTCC2601]